MNVSVSGTTSRSFCLCLSLCLSRLPTLHLSKKSIFKKITRSWKEPGFLPIWLWDCHPAVQSGWRMQRGPDERHATHSNASHQGHERSAHAIHKVLVRDFPIAPLTVLATAYSLTSALQGPECSTGTINTSILSYKFSLRWCGAKMPRILSSISCQPALVLLSPFPTFYDVIMSLPRLFVAIDLKDKR